MKYIRKTKEHIALNLVRELHKIVFKDSKDFAGNFRVKGVEVAVVNAAGDIIHTGRHPGSNNSSGGTYGLV